MDIGVDFHGRVHKPMAKVLAKALEPFHPMFLEEVVLPENEEHYKEVADAVAVPLATGERLYTRWQFKNIFKQGAIDIIQPDVALCGGILETRKIAAMAEAHDMAVAPHAPYGPVALAATLQVDSCTPNVFIQEQSLGIHYNKGFDLLDFVKTKKFSNTKTAMLTYLLNQALVWKWMKTALRKFLKKVWFGPTHNGKTTTAPSPSGKNK